jgi:hypothetical protein
MTSVDVAVITEIASWSDSILGVIHTVDELQMKNRLFRDILPWIFSIHYIYKLQARIVFGFWIFGIPLKQYWLICIIIHLVHIKLFNL